MAETVHNWDIQALTQMKEQMQKVHDILAENRDLLASEGFEILQNWQGMAGKKAMFVTAANAGKVDELVTKFDNLIEQLDTVINKCYIPCESEITNIISKLTY